MCSAGCIEFKTATNFNSKLTFTMHCNGNNKLSDKKAYNFEFKFKKIS